jgi:hypothetical protein
MASLLNGLSAMGQGVAAFAGTAGLEQQKSDLARQTAVLADQLATTRESTLQGQQQTFASGEAEKSRTATAALEQARLGSAAALQQSAQTFGAEQQSRQQTFAGGEAEKARQAQINLERMRLTQPPESIRMLQYLGVPIPGLSSNSTAASATVSPSGDGFEPQSSNGPAADASPAPATNAAATAEQPAFSRADLTNPLIAKLLGEPVPGSDDAIRRAVAKGVAIDPEFKGKAADQQAMEVENRLAIAKGTIASPATRDALAASIASYQLSPLDQRARQMAGGPETMKKVLELNPNYQEGRYPEINKVMSAFASGKQGDVIRSLNVGVQHLAVIDAAGEAMKNNNVQALNSLQNMFEQQFGAPEPTTFNGLKQIVGTEIEKAVAGGIGASADRDRLMKALDSASSPAQLKAITDGFRSLMVGQLSGLKSQYEDGTDFKSGPFAFENKLVPETKAALGLRSEGSGGKAPAAPALTIPSWVKPGDQYSPSRGQARGADGTLYGPQ